MRKMLTMNEAWNDKWNRLKTLHYPRPQPIIISTQIPLICWHCARYETKHLLIIRNTTQSWTRYVWWPCFQVNRLTLYCSRAICFWARRVKLHTLTYWPRFVFWLCHIYLALRWSGLFLDKLVNSSQQVSPHLFIGCDCLRFSPIYLSFLQIIPQSRSACFLRSFSFSFSHQVAYKLSLPHDWFMARHQLSIIIIFASVV